MPVIAVVMECRCLGLPELLADLAGRVHAAGAEDSSLTCESLGETRCNLSNRVQLCAQLVERHQKLFDMLDTVVSVKVACVHRVPVHPELPKSTLALLRFRFGGAAVLSGRHVTCRVGFS